MKLCRFHDVRVVEVSTGIDLTGPMGKVVAFAKAMASEQYIDNLHSQIWRGMEGQIHRGLSAGGRAFGYRSEPIYDPRNPAVIVGSRRVVHDAEAKVVRYIFVLYAPRTPSPTD